MKKKTGQEKGSSPQGNSSFIAIEGMHFFAHHGTYPEEKVLLTEFEVDIYIHSNFKQATQVDELGKTINYEVVYLLVKGEMGKPVNLMETLAERIAGKLKGRFDNIEKLRLRISKKNPPLRGEADRFFVEMEFNHLARCPETEKKFLCYKDETCWCQKVQVSEETRKMLKERYNKCVGPDALGYYSG